MKVSSILTATIPAFHPSVGKFKTSHQPIESIITVCQLAFGIQNKASLKYHVIEY
uniref:Uncharacterized protein n=1 Tax=Octopus bimaculoides TaxID=37653 RepID=A0A0L8GS40_OCTBM